MQQRDCYCRENSRRCSRPMAVAAARLGYLDEDGPHGDLVGYPLADWLVSYAIKTSTGIEWRTPSTARQLGGTAYAVCLR